MRGIDFDIEGGQTPTQIQALVDDAVAAQSQHPNLRFSFTLATLAASDGSFGGVSTLGDTAVRAVLASGLVHYTINLMVMDYGAPASGVCVVNNGSCDMGASAIQAATNLMHTYAVPKEKIELTPMIGLNDVVSGTFTLANIDAVANYVRQNSLAGLHYWSLDRDTPCNPPMTNASATCISVTGTHALDYTLRFSQQLN